MTKKTTQQNTFTGGEFSRLMFGRADVDKYATALQTCENAMPIVQGAWVRRPGTLRLLETRAGTDQTVGGNTRLIPFTYSTVQKYMLEFSDRVIRFYSGHSLVTQATQAITGISQASQGVVTYSGSDTYANGDWIYISDIVGMTQLNGRQFKVSDVNTAANTFKLKDWDGNYIDTSGYDAYVSAGTIAEILELTSPWLDEDVPDIRWVQSADVLYLFHPDYPTYQLIRTSALSWTLSEYVTIDGPYMAINATTTTLTPSAATGAGKTLTASSTTGINDNQGFLTTDVGRIVRLKEGSTWGYCTIIAWTSSTVVTVDINSTLTNTNAKVSWRLGLWSDTTGYPSCGVFYQDRLILAGTPISPQRLDGSKTGVYDNFQPSNVSGAVADDNAISFTLNSSDVNPIYWMINNVKALLVGTGGSEWQVKASALNTPLTPTNISANRMSSWGTENVAPIEIGVAALFLQKAGRKLRELAYVFQEDNFLSPDMTLLADHVTEGGLLRTVIQNQPQPILWGVRDDGVLVGMTYSRDQNVTAWHRHKIAGTSDGAADAEVIDAACQVAPDATRDELWLIVKRMVNGKILHNIEVVTKLWETTDAQATSFHLDNGYTKVNTSPSTSLTGVYWMEGQTVLVYADGVNLGHMTVTNGKLTLPFASSIVTIGLPYSSIGEDMPTVSEGNQGTGVGKIVKITRFRVMLLDTLGFKYRPTASEDSNNYIPWTEVSPTAVREAKALETDTYPLRLESTYDRMGNISWMCDGPWPGILLTLIPDTDLAEDS